MKKKLLATMAAIPLLGAFGGTGVLAAVNKDHTIQGDNATNNSFQEDVTVKITQASEFQVVIPKEIELDPTGTTGEYASDYTVVVSGNIAAGETITVVPDSTVTLLQGNKAQLTATIDQLDQAATWDEIVGAGKNLDGTIEVTGVTAGNWEGTFDFQINLQ